METRYILNSIVVGIGATLFTDLWNLFLWRAFRIPSLNYCLLGRWLRHMPEGTFTHSSIAAASHRPSECTVGWIAHYTIGIGLALMFIALASFDWLAQPTLLPSLLFGVSTVVFPLFIMQPAFGLGYAASKAPNPWQARLKSLMTHTVFGVGLWVSASGTAWLMKMSP